MSATGVIQPFADQMRRGNVHVNASRKTFKIIYAKFHTFHRMGACQEREAFFNATLLVEGLGEYRSSWAFKLPRFLESCTVYERSLRFT
jgi:hypothetical protein